MVAQGGISGSRCQRSAARHSQFIRQDEPRSKPPPLGKTPVDLVAAAAALDPVAISRLLDERFAAISFEQLIDTWLLPELERLGTAWATGQVSVAGEHMVAAAVQRRLNASSMLPARTVDFPAC